MTLGFFVGHGFETWELLSGHADKSADALMSRRMPLSEKTRLPSRPELFAGWVGCLILFF